jgi:DNA-binding transcriptional regulator YiaG
MVPKELLPLIQQLKRWRQSQGLSQSEVVRVLKEAGISVTLDSLQAWEIGRGHPSPWRWQNSSANGSEP